MLIMSRTARERLELAELLDKELPLAGTSIEELKAAAAAIVQKHYLRRCSGVNNNAEVGRLLGVTGRAVSNWRGQPRRGGVPEPPER